VLLCFSAPPLLHIRISFVLKFIKKKKLSACRGEGSAAGLQLRVRFVPAALLAMLRTALALQCVYKARDWTGHVD
jgi:hypothetical protein